MPALLSEEAPRLAFLVKCITEAVSRISTRDVVEAFIHQGGIKRRQTCTTVTRAMVQRVLDDLEVGATERVLINQKAQHIRLGGMGNSQSFGRKGGEELRLTFDEIWGDGFARSPNGAQPLPPSRMSSGRIPMKHIHQLLRGDVALLRRVAKDDEVDDEEFRNVAELVFTNSTEE
jgi:hypothetical protein